MLTNIRIKAYNKIKNGEFGWGNFHPHTHERGTHMATLIKIDRNGSKHYEGMVECDRCGGTGTYVWGAIINGAPQYAGVCYKCNGVGKVHGKWIERTPEYQAKLDAKREAKHAAMAAKFAEAREAERVAREQEEARERARKAISKYVGKVGEKIEFNGMFVKTACFDAPAYMRHGMERIYIHTFKDTDGNVIIWKTKTGISEYELAYGSPVIVRGTVKAHSEYLEEKQTAVIRVKITKP